MASDADNVENVKVRGIGASIAAGLAGVASLFGADFWVSNKMRTFDAKVADLTRADIMSRTTGAIGAGLDSSDIKLKHTLDLINSGEHNFAKFIYNIGGKSNFAIAVALAIGGAAASAYWFLAPKAKYQLNAPSDKKWTREISREREVTPEQPAKEFAKTIEPKGIDPASITKNAEKTEAEVQAQR